MARVSVIIPVFNGAATVAEAIDSALAQTFRDLEVIVVNDGSTDATPQILACYAARIKVINQSNRGIAAGRNSGAQASSGEYLAFLDCDDTWRPQMVERAIAVLDRDPQCVLTFCNLAIVDSTGQALGAPLVGPGLDHGPSLDEMLSRLWPIMPSAVVMRRSVLDEVGGFSEQFSSYGYEDVYTWLLVRERGDFRYIPDQLGNWRFSLFPRPLKIGAIDSRAKETFERLLWQRFGVHAGPLIRQRRRAPRSILGYVGLAALAGNDRRTARRAFLLALRLDPLRFKNYMRLLRTVLPRPLARSLGGRTARARGSEPTRPAAP
jgi:glycosyltransferase involved in cell wall biosynthesis